MHESFDPRLPMFAPVQQHREQITGEHEPRADGPEPDFPGLDWIGTSQQGGGYVPPGYRWTSSPRERQESLSMG